MTREEIITDLIDKLLQQAESVGRENPEYALAALAGALARAIYICWKPEHRPEVLHHFSEEIERICLQDVERIYH